MDLLSPSSHSASAPAALVLGRLNPLSMLGSATPRLHVEVRVDHRSLCATRSVAPAGDEAPA